MALFLFPRGSEHHLMFVPERSANVPVWVALSVDAGRPHSALEADAQDRLYATGSALHALCGELGLSATWGIAELSTSPLVARLCTDRHATPAHEIAVRLDPQWSVPQSPRTLLAETLTRCLRQAELGGLEIRTVFADEPLLSGNGDLLVKRGITSVRELSASRHRPDGGRQEVRPLRYGLWEYRISHTFPIDRPQALRRISGLLTKSGREPSAASPPVLHLSVQVSRLTEGTRSAWRNMERTLRLLERLRSSEGLRIEPLRVVTARLASVPCASPQRSILRRVG